MNTKTKFASKIQFRNFAKKNAILIGTNDEFWTRIQIDKAFDENLNHVTRWDDQANVAFFFVIGLTQEEHLKLKAAGAEIRKVEIETGFSRTVSSEFVYGLKVA
jgi:hypothetical protein